MTYYKYLEETTFNTLEKAQEWIWENLTIEDAEEAFSNNHNFHELLAALQNPTRAAILYEALWNEAFAEQCNEIVEIEMDEDEEED